MTQAIAELSKTGVVFTDLSEDKTGSSKSKSDLTRMRSAVKELEAVIRIQSEQMKQYKQQGEESEGSNIQIDKKQEALGNTMEQNVKVLDAVLGNLKTNETLSEIDYQLLDSTMKEIQTLTDELGETLLEQLLPNSKGVSIQSANSDLKQSKLTEKYIRQYLFGIKPDLLQKPEDYVEEVDQSELIPITAESGRSCGKSADSMGEQLEDHSRVLSFVERKQQRKLQQFDESKVKIFDLKILKNKANPYLYDEKYNQFLNKAKNTTNSTRLLQEK